jgi:hypothetical protein
MMTITLENPYMTLSPTRRKALVAALQVVLHPAQLTAARECIMAEEPGRGMPSPEEILFWMRLNMPGATARVEELLHDGE